MHIAARISPKRSSTWIFLAVAYGVAWLTWLPGILSSCGIIGAVPWPPLFAIGACGPLVAAVWCIHRSDGWKGVRYWLLKGFGVPVDRRWWALILLAPFITPAFVLAGYQLLGKTISSLPVLSQPWIVLPTSLLMVSIGGGQEEYGWRGYLLGQLQTHWKPWQADLILVAFHSLWHLPLFFITMTLQSHYSFWVFLAFGAGFTLLINQIYRRTNGSLLAAILFHGLVNAGLDTFPLVGPAVDGAAWPFILVGLVYALLAQIIRSRRGAQ